MFREFEIKRLYQGSLSNGADLLDGLLRVMKELDISAGLVSGIGSVTEARLAYYNQDSKKYEEKHLSELMEIVSLKENVSIKEGQIFPHLHAVLSRSDFSAIGGHVMPKTYVFALEFEILSFRGEPFVREFDQATGLFLWKK